MQYFDFLTAAASSSHHLITPCLPSLSTPVRSRFVVGCGEMPRLAHRGDGRKPCFGTLAALLSAIPFEVPLDGLVSFVLFPVSFSRFFFVELMLRQAAVDVLAIVSVVFRPHQVFRSNKHNGAVISLTADTD